MKLYKLIYPILDAPFEGTDQDITGIKYFNDCPKCGFGDEEQTSDLCKNEIFPIVSVRLKELIEKENLSGITHFIECYDINLKIRKEGFNGHNWPNEFIPDSLQDMVYSSDLDEFIKLELEE